MDIMKKVDEVVDKIKSDKGILAKFEASPIPTIEELLGIDLPDDQLKPAVEAVKAKLLASDLADKIKGLGGFFK